MTIQEAIKSGKPFRKKSWLNEISNLRLGSVNNKNEQTWDFYSVNSGKQFILSTIEILADDWEIEEKSITITKSQFLNKLTLVMKQIAAENKHYFMRPGGSSDEPYEVETFAGWSKLIEELGL